MFVWKTIQSTFAIAVLATFVAPLRAEFRTWTDKSGKFKVEAELVEVKGDKVALKKTSGSVITLSAARLSETDRQYLQALAQQQTTEPVVDQTVNLMRTAKYSASSTWDKTTYTAAKAFDGLPNTRWNSRSGDTRGAWLAARWDRPVTVRQAVVRQAFDRISGLKLQVLNGTKKTWRNVFVLDGEALKRQKKGRAGRTDNDGSVNPVFTMRLGAPVRTKGLRLLITSVVRMQQGSVSVFEFEVFGEPAEDAPEVMQSLAKLPYLDRTRASLSFPDAVTEPPTWNDVNPPFDPAEFFQVPPAEENAAPLYLDALCEFSPGEMDGLFPEMPEQERKQWRLRDMKLYKEKRRLDDAWEKDPQSVDNAAVDAWIANYDAGFEKLAAAQQRPRCMFQTGLSIHTLVPHIHVARQVAMVVEWRTRRDIQRGDLERPLQDLKILLRLNRDLRVRGFLVAQFTSSALDDRCCELVRTILNAPGIDARQCDRLLALLAEHETKTIDAFLEANRAEYFLSRQALHDLQHRKGTFDPQFMRDELSIDGDETSPLACIKFITDFGVFNPQKLAKVAARFQSALLPGAWSGGKMLSDKDYVKEVEALNRYFASILALAEQPNIRRMHDTDLKAAIAALYEPILETALAGLFIPPEIAAMETIRRSEARLRGTQCLVALRCWQLEHADPPPDIETLVKAAGMPRVPMDPYSDRPLRMGSLAGKPVIYSVGSDGQDDKAKIEWNPYTVQPGDFIFRLETPPQ